MSTRRLVLWDIDHTLIETGGVGSEVFRDAFQFAVGRRMTDMPDPTGLTERQIFVQALAANHVDTDLDTDRVFLRFASAQAAAYRARTADLLTRGRVLPGVPAALAALRDTEGVVQTVLSGNTRLAARAKLEAFGLTDQLQLDRGAYGDDVLERAELVPIAWKRTSVDGHQFGPSDTVLIGDTPSDIWAAKANGCRIVAVATGRTSADDLRAAAADGVVQDLTNIEDLLALVKT